MDRLQQLGRVVNVTYRGDLVVKISGREPPGYRAVVSDMTGADLGRVMEVIGPVRGPYVLVRPLDRSVASRGTLGREVYVRNTRSRGDRPRERRRR